MRILFITQWFQPERHFKGLPFARELAKRGHQVYVLTGFPNYPEGRIYPGYRLRLYAREEMEGIPVYRVALYPSHDRSTFRRILNYVSFAFSSAILGPFIIPRVDVAYVFHVPATIGLPAIVFKLFRRVPFVFDVNDLWPEGLALTGMFDSRIGNLLVGWWCKVVYRIANRVTVVSPGFRRALLGKGVPARKLKMIYNWCEEASLSARSAREDPVVRELASEPRFNILYAGNMGQVQALAAVLDAAALLQESAPRVRFIFIGGGTEEESLRQKAETMRLPNVVFLPRRPMSDMPPLFDLADALLVHLKSDPLLDVTIPGKTQAYLRVGKPIIIGVSGDAADLVRQSGAGIVCEPENHTNIAEAVRTISALSPDELTEMGRKGKAFYAEELSMKSGADKFENIFRDIIRN